LLLGDELFVHNVHVVFQHAVFSKDWRAGIGIVKRHVELYRGELQTARIGTEPNAIFEPIQRLLVGGNVNDLGTVSG
jgi:hypothetical protein